jgi:hypothetical protein
MHSLFRKRGAILTGLLALILAAVTPTLASAKPEPGAKGRGFRMFARPLGALTVNRVYCGLSSTGEVCVDSTNSSTIGGGFWPKGTANQYVFNSGLQIAGIIGPDGGDWADDTTGAFFFDPKGTTQHGEQVQPIFNTQNPVDNAFISDQSSTDPVALAARVPETDANGLLFNNLLRGRTAASQGDVWWLSWDGNPGLLAGRPHPLGVVVEQRGLGWNFPSGNEDIVYFIYTFYNITSINPADYAAVRPGMREILIQQANTFQQRNEATFGISIPDGGYTITNMFANFAADMDVGDAGQNYASVNVPFALGYTYEHTFSQFAGWAFDDATIFGDPFFKGTGFVGVKYLKSPEVGGVEVGLSLFSNTTNGGGDLNDPANVKQLYRYISGTLSTSFGDGACNFNPLTQKICFIRQTSAADVRFFQSSGPLTLAPGEFGSVSVAYLFSASVATGGTSVCPSCDIKPGAATIIANMDDPATVNLGVNPIDSITGFLDANDANLDGVLTQNEFTVVPGSLLGKAKVAQAVFDAGFLLPFAPEPPDFFLIPGDNQVTVMWRASPTEQTGDPFFAIANQATVLCDPNDPGSGQCPNALYDPNYREFDVEGYRVYRGRVDAPNSLRLLAQFDYTGTVITDFAGQINPIATCAPEIGVTGGCPVVFDPIGPGLPRTTGVDIPLVGPIVQVKLGGRVLLATGDAILLSTDTMPTGNANFGSCAPTACPALSDNGVPFVYVDNGVRNNFRYFYSVSAFDINSFQSGPANLESARITKPVIPRRPASNYENTSDVQVHVVGRGVAMDTIITADPTIDPVTGVFSGPSRPANGLTPAFIGFVKEVIAAPGAFSITLDSITVGEADEFGCCGGVAPGQPAIYHVTAQSGGNTTVLHLPLTMNGNSTAPAAGNVIFDAVTIDASLASRFGATGPFTLKGAAFDTLPSLYLAGAPTLGCRIKGAPIAPGLNDCIYNGHRWRDGPTAPTSSPLPSDRLLPETFADPHTSNCNHDGGNGPVCLVVGFNNAGSVTGVDSIHAPQSYTQLIRRWRNVDAVLGPVFRAADMNVYWGAGGTVDSVIDVTHNVVVPFDTVFGASWGILNANNPGTSGSSDTRPTVLTANDFTCIYPINNGDPNNPILNPTLDAANAYPCSTDAFLEQTATLGSVAFYKDAQTNAIAAPVSGNGFMFYVTGTVTMFQMSALPAAGTVWTVRTYAGIINGGNGIGGGNKGPYTFVQAIRPMTVVGAEVQVAFSVVNQVNAPVEQSLSRVHTVPDPYYVTSEFEQTTDTKVIKFVNLPQDAIVRIYSSSGVLVNLLEHHSTTFGGALDWNVRNRNNQVVASGVYFYHIESGNARKVGRFTIVNFAQ